MAKKAQRLLTADIFRKPLFWLLLITLLGGFFRFYNLNWDLKHSFHPDERNILGQTSGIQPGDGYRVHFFAYGQLPVYLYRATGELVSTPQLLMDLFKGNAGAAQAGYWVFLALLFSGICWFGWKEKYKLPAFGVSSFFFLLTFFKFNPNQFSRFDIINSWFSFLEGQRAVFDFPTIFHFPSLNIPILPVVCFVFVAAAALGFSALFAHFLELDWVGTPFYTAVGTVVVLGVLPGFLREDLHLPKTFSLLAFTTILLAGAIWFAWVSRWGRILLGVFAVWVFFASRAHGGNSYTGYGECMIIGRWWAALFSTLTIGVVFLFVQRVYKNISMALVASASFAFAVVSIEQTHYCITESFITLMCMVVAVCSYEIIRKQGSWNSYLLTGAAFGVAMAAKTSSLFYLLIILLAHLVLLSQKDAKLWEKNDKKEVENRPLYTFMTVSLLSAVLLGFLVVGLKFRGVIQDLFYLNLPLANGIGLSFFIFFALAGILLSVWGITEFKVLRAQMVLWTRLIAAGALSFFIFCLFSPWSLLDFHGFMESQNYEWHVVSIADACYVLQFKDTPRYLYHLSNLMSVELWWPLGITVVLGMFWVIGRFIKNLATPTNSGYLLPMPFVRGRGFKFSLPDILILVWFLAYFGFIGSWNTKFVRYMVPLIPVFCIFGARFLTDIFQWMKNKISFERHLRALVLTLVLGGSLFYSAAYMNVYANPHTWIEASVWIFKNVPLGSAIATEAWDDGLPTGVDHEMDSRVVGSMGPQNYKHVDCTPYEMHGFPTDDSTIKKNYYVNFISQPDYISLACKKLWYTLTDLSPEFRPNGYKAYPVTSRYYRALWSGLLGFKMVGEFHSFPKLFGWEHPDDMAEESFSVYDHPRAVIFKRFATVPPEQVMKILESDEYVKGINRDIMRNITPANVDAFIAERHKYLEEKGLLKKLEETGTLTAASETISPKARTAAPEDKKEPPKQTQASKKSQRIIPTTAAEIPTPEIKIIPPETVPGLPDPKTMAVLKNYSEHPVVEENIPSNAESPEETVVYQLRAWVSWLLLLVALGVLALPLTLKIMGPISPGAYSLSKILGFFVFSWVVWFFTSIKVGRFTIGWCWFWLLLLSAASIYFFWRNQKFYKSVFSKLGQSWIKQELAFVSAFALFSIVKIYISHIHDPVGEGYNGGGEAAMDFGFLSTVVRGETFPPQNMWMAGLPIGYTFYYGHLMMGILTKTLGLVPAVTYNLGLITLFATIFSGAFGLAYALSGRILSGWIAGLLCAVAGNVAGSKQYLEAIHQCFASISLSPLISHTYDFFGPTRVIPPLSINEFPYFSVLYGDMHAHTLAMPFAMLLIGILASLYTSEGTKVFTWKKDLLPYGAVGFLMGGIAFLNTWEVPTWLVLTGIVLAVHNLAAVNGNILQKGLRIIFVSIVAALTLLGLWLVLRPASNPHALGGSTAGFVGFGGFGLLGAILWLFMKKTTKILSSRLLIAGFGMGIVLAVMLLMWSPFFFKEFHPQQSTVLWVLPSIRTSVRNYFNVYGSFLVVLLLSFLTAYSAELFKWMGTEIKKTGKKSSLVENSIGMLEKLVNPKTAVWGMTSLGLASLAVIWGASWIQWTEPQDKVIYSQLFGTAAAGLFLAAIYFKDRVEFWLGLISVVMVWMGALVLQWIHLVRDMTVTLELGFFSILWMLGFFHLGLAVKVFKNRGLSFAYILVSFFFLLTAALEIFAMSEYFGFGDGMRNNSLFKYGINAWTLASVGAGVFAPKIFDFMTVVFKAVKKESLNSRRLLLTFSVFSLFVLLWALMETFIPFMQTPLIALADIVMVAVILTWGLLEGWFKKGISQKLFIGFSSLLILSSVLGLLPQGFGRILGLFQQWGSMLSAEIIFPAGLACIATGIGALILEGQKNLGRKMAVGSWLALASVLGIMVSIYPFSASVRKCHGFLNYFRQQWGGFVENPTLNGLAYIKRSNPGDDAAIRFLNDHIPGQPCMLEFVGAGYNTWGSRFSIFTGIPALMGWDGHVGEWVGARLGDDIRNRASATQQIFSTPDVHLAKKMLDAYGVRLVMVGTVERHGAAEKQGYPAEGLAKFANFLPLIYKNPQVEIYYNPPPVN